VLAGTPTVSAKAGIELRPSLGRALSMSSVMRRSPFRSGLMRSRNAVALGKRFSGSSDAAP
jgi:hypothetical protein